MPVRRLYRDNDNYIRANGLRNEATGVYFSAAASLTVRIVDRNVVPELEVLAPQAMTFVVGSNGDFEATIDQADLDDLDLEKTYTLEIVGSESGSDFNRRQNVLFDYYYT